VPQAPARTAAAATNDSFAVVCIVHSRARTRATVGR
jgi:hypothetical protein